MKNNDFETYLANFYEAVNKQGVSTEQLTNIAGKLVDDITLFDADELDSEYYCPILDKIFDDLFNKGLDLNIDVSNVDFNKIDEIIINNVLFTRK